MDDKGNRRSGFSIVESMNPYSYSSNNPIKYRDPTGLDDVLPTQFTQDQWTVAAGFESGFSDTACAATSLLNELSEQYTSETGKALTFDEGAAMMKNAIDKTFTNNKGQTVSSIGKNDANVNNWSVAANAMWAKTGEKGTWSMNSSPGAILHRIWWIDSDRDGVSTHFISSGQNNAGTFDPYTGNSSSITPKTYMSAGMRGIWDALVKNHPDSFTPYNGPTVDRNRPTRDLYFRKGN